MVERRLCGLILMTGLLSVPVQVRSKSGKIFGKKRISFDPHVSTDRHDVCHHPPPRAGPRARVPSLARRRGSVSRDAHSRALRARARARVSRAPRDARLGVRRRGRVAGCPPSPPRVLARLADVRERRVLRRGGVPGVRAVPADGLGRGPHVAVLGPDGGLRVSLPSRFRRTGLRDHDEGGAVPRRSRSGSLLQRHGARGGGAVLRRPERRQRAVRHAPALHRGERPGRGRHRLLQSARQEQGGRLAQDERERRERRRVASRRPRVDLGRADGRIQRRRHDRRAEQQLALVRGGEGEPEVRLDAVRTARRGGGGRRRRRRGRRRLLVRRERLRLVLRRRRPAVPSGMGRGRDRRAGPEADADERDDEPEHGRPGRERVRHERDLRVRRDVRPRAVRAAAGRRHRAAASAADASAEARLRRRRRDRHARGARGREPGVRGGDPRVGEPRRGARRDRAASNDEKRRRRRKK